jgi:hypothetical protein
MRRLLTLAAALLILAPATAFADAEFAIQAEGGVSHYNRSLSGSDLGAAYGARLTITPIQFLGFELGYLGTRNNVSGTSTTTGGGVTVPSATLSTNEGYADLRINILPGPVMPYIFGGYGLTWVSGADAFASGDHNNTLPFGAGLDFNIGAFKIGGRFQYNYLFDAISVSSNGTSAGVSKSNADFWTATLALGVTFH